MDLTKQSLLPITVVTTLALFYVPALYPTWNLTFLAPWLVTICYKKSFIESLWIGFLCGIGIDFLSSYAHLGIFAVNYTVTTTLLYPLQHYFFPDRYSTLPLMTFLWSFCSTAFQLLLLYLFEHAVQLSWFFLFVDCFVIPAMDAGYAFICFVLPAMFFGKQRRRGQDYFTQRQRPLYKKN